MSTLRTGWDCRADLETRKNYMLDDPEWREDKVPEVFDGKNVSFLHPPRTGPP